MLMKAELHFTMVVAGIQDACLPDVTTVSAHYFALPQVGEDIPNSRIFGMCLVHVNGIGDLT